jgi:hypothetical protein
MGSKANTYYSELKVCSRGVCRGGAARGSDARHCRRQPSTRGARRLWLKNKQNAGLMYIYTMYYTTQGGGWEGGSGRGMAAVDALRCYKDNDARSKNHFFTRWRRALTTFRRTADGRQQPMQRTRAPPQAACERSFEQSQGRVTLQTAHRRWRGQKCGPVSKRVNRMKKGARREKRCDF